MNTCVLFLLPFFVILVSCRDFYIGMFKRNDYLVAQDRLFKERVPYEVNYAHYGRVFKCPITYFRVVDRLGMGRGPRVQVVRGGLLKKFLVLRLTSPYNLPISVNIYVGCKNRQITKSATIKTTKSTKSDTNKSGTITTKISANTTKNLGDAPPPGDATTPGGAPAPDDATNLGDTPGDTTTSSDVTNPGDAPSDTTIPAATP